MPLASILHAFSRARSASRARTAKYSSLAWMNLEQESADTVLVGLADSLLVSTLKFTVRLWLDQSEQTSGVELYQCSAVKFTMPHRKNKNVQNPTRCMT